MSRETMWRRVRMAWAMLAGTPGRDVEPGRPRESPPESAGGEPPVAAEGFVEEALPWLEAVYRYALRLTRGDRDAAEDLAQETFLRAHGSWDSYQRGTNVKAWLFTICRNAFLNRKGRARSRYERPASDLETPVEELVSASAFDPSSPDAEKDFFESLIDDRVVEAIDALPEKYHEVLVLSDLGDLRYAEIAQVLGVPVGTVKSRLFRARKRLQEQLWEYAVESGYVQEGTR